MRGRALVAGLLVVLGTVGLAAQEVAVEELGEKSLDELLQLKLVTPTMREQRAAETPAIVSVLTAEQIQSLGVTTLYEALSYLPGVVVTESYFGYTMVNVRGVLQTHYNNKVLLLVNGHPTREVVNGSFHLELIPIETVERIEFVRGPGSALYGTNAFAGVINVITKRGGNGASRGVAVGGGSFSTYEGSVTYGTGSADSELLLGASTRGDDGYPYRVRQDERGSQGELDYSNDVTNALVAFTVQDFTLTAAAFSQHKSKFGLTPVLAYTGISRYDAGFLDLKWSREVREKLVLTGRLRYDQMDRDGTAVHSLPYDGFMGHANSDAILDSGGSLLAVEANMSYTMSERNSILGGVEYQLRQSDPYYFRFADDGSIHPQRAWLHSPSAHDYSVFAQGLFGLTDRADVVVGFRFNDDVDAGSSFLPRLGLVYRLGADTYLKALYAEAYRTPDFFEKEVETFDVLYGDPNLEPERTRNFDLAVDTVLGTKYNLQVNAFFLRTSDLIVRVPTSTPDEQGPNASVYANGGGDEIWGVETSLVAQPAKPVKLFANYSYRDGEGRETGEENRYIGNHTFNLGLAWKLARFLNLSPSVQYVGEQGDVDGYVLLNTVLSFELARSLSLAVVGRNLADEEYEYPEYVRRRIAGIPGGPERSFFVRLRWRY